MILIVAVAAGLAINDASYRSLPGLANLFFFDGNHGILVPLGVILPHVICLTPATLAIRLRMPRPALSRVARQPGTVACAVALSCVAFFACLLSLNFAFGRDALSIQEMVNSSRGNRSSGTSMPIWPLAIPAYADRVGFAVAGAWLAQWSARCWRPERSWIDRLGRALGSSWIVAACLVWFRTFLY